MIEIDSNASTNTWVKTTQVIEGRPKQLQGTTEPRSLSVSILITLGRPHMPRLADAANGWSDSHRRGLHSAKRHGSSLVLREKSQSPQRPNAHGVWKTFKKCFHRIKLDVFLWIWPMHASCGGFHAAWCVSSGKMENQRKLGPFWIYQSLLQNSGASWSALIRPTSRKDASWRETWHLHRDASWCVVRWRVETKTLSAAAVWFPPIRISPGRRSNKVGPLERCGVASVVYSSSLLPQFGPQPHCLRYEDVWGMAPPSV